MMGWFRLPRSFRTYLIVGFVITIAILTFSTSRMLKVDASDSIATFPFLVNSQNHRHTVTSEPAINESIGPNLASMPDSRPKFTTQKTSNTQPDYHTTSASLQSTSSLMNANVDENLNHDSTKMKPEMFSDTIVISANTGKQQVDFKELTSTSPSPDRKVFIDNNFTNDQRDEARQQTPHSNQNKRSSHFRIVKLPPSNATTLSPYPMRFSNGSRSLSSGPDEAKRNYVKGMMSHAWKGYRAYAWGYSELRPISKLPHTESVFGAEKLGATIVDGIDTLYIMGLMDEYQDARNWIDKHLDFDKNIELSVFETNIRYLGGLLSIYALTKDQMYLEKAKQIGDRLLPAFESPSGIPYSNINLKTGYASNHPWSFSSAILSEFGSMHLEFIYLSYLTGDNKYRDKVLRLRNTIRKAVPRSDGLYNNYINTETGQWLTRPTHISMGAMGDSFYEYLIKAYVQTNGADREAYEMYFAAIDAFEEKLIYNSAQSGLTYFAEIKDLNINHKMDSLACFAGGMLILGASKAPEPIRSRHFQLAQGITNTCHESCIRATSHLGPETFLFTNQVEAKALGHSDKYYILRPEILESYFYMWRYTHDPKYRDWAWDFVQALEKYCRVEDGYSGIRNVYQPSPKDDVQQSFFLAEVLKYLYLIFSEDELIGFDDWFFNTEAHPFPILNKQLRSPLEHLK